MSRLSFLIIPALLLSSSTALAASQSVTEQVIAFEERVEAPAIAVSVRGSGPERATEQLATFEAPESAAAASLASSGSVEPTTERIAAFESRVEAPRVATAPAHHQGTGSTAEVAAPMHADCTCRG